MGQGDVLGFIKNRPGNLLGNGGFDFFQRALSTISAGSHPTYPYNAADRWANATGAGGPTSYVFSREIDSPNGLTKYCGQLEVNEPSSGRQEYIAQRIESVFAQAISGDKTSLSLWVKSPSCRQVIVNLYTADVEDDFSAVTLFETKTFSVTDNNSWQKLLWNSIDVPADGSRGVQVEIEFSDWSVTAATTNVRFTQAMMNEGPAVAKFERAGGSYDGDLAFCQRYFEKTYDLDIPVGTSTGISMVALESFGSFSVEFLKRKRIIPIMVAYSRIGTMNQMSNNIGNPSSASDLGLLSIAPAEKSFQVWTGGAWGRTFHYTADAEL